MFKNCDQPLPADTCDTTQNFWCQNKACIPKTYLCDLSDDCGDNSDEFYDQCANYKRYDWEGVDSTTFFLQGESVITSSQPLCNMLLREQNLMTYFRGVSISVLLHYNWCTFQTSYSHYVPL